MNKATTLSAALIAAAMSVAAGGDVIEYENAADEWLAATSCDFPEVGTFAWEEFYFPFEGPTPCVLAPGEIVAVVNLYGTITVTAYDEFEEEVCAIQRVGCEESQTDAFLTHHTVYDFSLPIKGFYTYYGSMIDDSTVTAHLYAGEQLVESLVSPVVGSEYMGVGHGFTSAVPIDRIVFDSIHASDSVVALGWYCGQPGGQPMLGTSTIDGIPFEVPHDFGVVWADCTPCSLADFDQDGVVDVSDFLILLGFWGPCPPQCLGDIDGDGTVGILDFLLLLGYWGPCP